MPDGRFTRAVLELRLGSGQSLLTDSPDAGTEEHLSFACPCIALRVWDDQYVLDPCGKHEDLRPPDAPDAA